MENIKQLLETRKNQLLSRHPQWQAMRFVSHGMGMIRLEEHNDLVSMGAIRCENGVDSIVADYPKLVIVRKEEKTYIDLGGNLFQLKMEMEVHQKKGSACYIAYYPKKWIEYQENKNKL